MNLYLTKAYSGLINSKTKNLFLLIPLFLLFLLSFLYWLIIKVLRFVKTKNQRGYKIPVISVGNITWGGTGKTPLVIKIAQYLKDRGVRVAVVHHGRFYQDEVKMMQYALGNIAVFQERSKRASVEKIVAENAADIVILDDGYQQWGIKKDIEILCMDYKSPFGNRFLIPRGNLREEIAAINRAEIIVFNKVATYRGEDTIVKEIRKYNSKAALTFSRYQTTEIINLINGVTVSLADLNNVPCAFLTAIADPDSVRVTLRNLGLDIKEEFIYPDHYVFSKKDLRQVKRRLREEVKTIFITEKDYAKIENNIELLREIFAENRLLLIKIKLEFLENAQALFGRLDILLDSISG